MEKYNPVRNSRLRNELQQYRIDNGSYLSMKERQTTGCISNGMNRKFLGKYIVKIYRRT